MLVYYNFRPKRLNKSNTFNIIHNFPKIKRLFSLFEQMKGDFLWKILKIIRKNGLINVWIL